MEVSGVKVRFCGGGDDITGFTHGKVYELVKAYKIKPNKSENGEVAVVDNTGDWYTYFIDFFEPVDDDAKDLTGEDAPPIIEIPNDDKEYQEFIDAKSVCCDNIQCKHRLWLHNWKSRRLSFRPSRLYRCLICEGL